MTAADVTCPLCGHRHEGFSRCLVAVQPAVGYASGYSSCECRNEHRDIALRLQAERDEAIAAAKHHILAAVEEWTRGLCATHKAEAAEIAKNGVPFDGFCFVCDEIDEACH